MNLTQITPLPQVVPGRVCLTCEVCCRFPEPDSFLRPYFTGEEIRRAVAGGLDSAHFPAPNGGQINVVPHPSADGYICAAFDPTTSECRIYDARPLDCQIYPLAVMWSADERDVVLGWDTKCPFFSEGSKGRGARGNREGQEASDKGEGGLSPLEAYATRISDLIEQTTVVETFVNNPQLIGRFQDDVVILRPLPRLTKRLHGGQKARDKRQATKGLSETSRLSPLAPCPSPLVPFTPAHPRPYFTHPPGAGQDQLFSHGTLLPATLYRVTLEDRSSFDDAMASVDTSLSAYAFAPHMIWRDQFHYTRCEIAGHVCLFAEYADGLYMPLPPLGPGPYAEPLTQAFVLMRDRNCGSAVSRVENIPDELRIACEALGYRVTPKDSDYLYRATDLAALTGDRYKSQRAAYNQLVRAHSVDYAPYHDRDRNACLDLYRRWTVQQEALGLDPVALHMLGDAAFAHREALTSYLALGLVGRVVRVDGAIGAYTFGYARSPTVWCVLLEVADRSIRGLAQFIFREFCREAAERGFAFINTMDDSGLERLRWSKHAYRPCRLLSNFIVTEY